MHYSITFLVLIYFLFCYSYIRVFWRCSHTTS